MGTALNTGVTALLANQQRLDVIASNISNVNTTGYRGSRVLFKDLFSQTVQGGRAPVGNFGGTNPSQVGLGVRVGSIDVNHGQGSLLSTGIESDLAIQGSGFFVLNDGMVNRFTRDGSFRVNADGMFVDSGTGLFVQGFMADEDGNVEVTASPQNIEIPVGAQSIVRATSDVRLVGNLNSSADVGHQVTRNIEVFDSLGTSREVTLVFTKRQAVEHEGADRNAWDWEATFTNEEDPPVTTTVGAGTLLFDGNGDAIAEGTVNGAFQPREPGDPNISISGADLGDLDAFPEDPFEFFADFTRITELSSSSDVTVSRQDGFPRGTLENFTISRDGVINGEFSNGLTRVLGQVALASFANDGGLERFGDNLFRETPSSGLAQIGLPSTGGRGSVSGGVLEGSNVDLGTEFSNLIITQRSYQGNARSITTADNLLQETVNLIR